MSAPPAPGATSAQDGWDASVFEWLAGLFIGPMSVQTVASYRQGLGARFLLAVMEDPDRAAGVQQMQAALVSRPSPVAAARHLAAAFIGLFEGPGGSSSASPYESAHIDGSGRLFQAPTRDMERMLRRCGLSSIPSLCEPADHVSVELALLGHVLRGGGSADDVAELLDDHLLVWAPRFVERCRGADASGFYAGAARVLAATLASRQTAPRLGHATEPETGEAPWRTR